jgi:hypothetical protein
VRLALAVLMIAGTAHAQPLVLGQGQIEADLVVEANLAPGSFAVPLSLAPDVWWGASDRWTVGIIHSDPAIDRFTPGASLCVRTDDMICTHLYRGGGIDVRWSALTGDFALAPRARLLVRDLDPWKPALTLGALAQWVHGRVAVTGDPYLQIGLANRQLGNRTQLFLPVELAVAFAPRWQVDLRTGYTSEVAVWRDGYHIPAWAGLRVAVTPSVEIGGAVGFYTLLGPQATPKERALFVTLGWRS